MKTQTRQQYFNDLFSELKLNNQPTDKQMSILLAMVQCNKHELDLIYELMREAYKNLIVLSVNHGNRDVLGEYLDVGDTIMQMATNINVKTIRLLVSLESKSEGR